MTGDESHERTRADARTRKSVETRRRIMETASQIISERGNTVFKMSEVSRRCGMSKGALYYYFSDRENLVNEIFEDELEELVRVLEHSVEEAQSAHEAMMRMCEEFVQRASGGGPLAMAIVRELVRFRELGTDVHSTRVSHIVDMLAQQLELAKGEGIVRPDVDAHRVAVAACGAYTFSAVSFLMDSLETGVPNEYFSDELMQIIVRGIGVVS